MNRPDEAAICFDRLILLCPKDPERWAWKGDAFPSRQMYSEAIICFNQAIDLGQVGFSHVLYGVRSVNTRQIWEKPKLNEVS